MTEPVEPPPTILRRLQVSTAAWEVLCETTSTTLGLAGTSSTTLQQQPAPLKSRAQGEQEATASAWAELHSLNMSPAPGEVAQEWLGAVALFLTAPISITARATFNGVSTTSALGLQAGRGISVHQRHLSERAAHGTVITGSEDSMEITLFKEENVWGAVARLLPPLDTLRAAARPAPLVGDPAVLVRPTTPAGAGSAGPGPDTLAPDTQLPGMFDDEEANVTLSVLTAAPPQPASSTPESALSETAVPAAAVPARLWAGMWSVQQGQLFSVSTRRAGRESDSEAGREDPPQLRLTAVPAGHIAHELLYAVTGAHDLLIAQAQSSPAHAGRSGRE